MTAVKQPHSHFADEDDSKLVVGAAETYTAQEYDRSNPDFNPVAAIIEVLLGDCSIMRHHTVSGR